MRRWGGMNARAPDTTHFLMPAAHFTTHSQSRSTTLLPLPTHHIHPQPKQKHDPSTSTNSSTSIHSLSRSTTSANSSTSIHRGSRPQGTAIEFWKVTKAMNVRFDPSRFPYIKIEDRCGHEWTGSECRLCVQSSGWKWGATKGNQCTKCCRTSICRV